MCAAVLYAMQAAWTGLGPRGCLFGAGNEDVCAEEMLWSMQSVGVEDERKWTSRRRRKKKTHRTCGVNMGRRVARKGHASCF